MSKWTDAFQELEDSEFDYIMILKNIPSTTFTINKNNSSLDNKIVSLTYDLMKEELQKHINNPRYTIFKQSSNNESWYYIFAKKDASQEMYKHLFIKRKNA